MSLADIEQILYNAMGLNAASIGSASVLSAVNQRMAACKLSDIHHYKQILDTDEIELKELIEEVVVPETWFFRDTNPFKMLEKYVKQEWLPSEPQGPLRILSLPCATGEEPYSIAITLIEAGLMPSQIKIDAFDISERNIRRCKEARYTNNSFRGVDPYIRDRFFSNRDDAYHPDILIRAMVNFATASVLDISFMQTRLPYDVVFCRNLLIYFDRATQAQAAQNLYKLLNSNGILFVGHAETGIFNDQCHVSRHYPKAFALRKNKEEAKLKSKSKRVIAKTRSPLNKTSSFKPNTTNASTAKPGTSSPSTAKPRMSNPKTYSSRTANQQVVGKTETRQRPEPVYRSKSTSPTAKTNTRPSSTSGSTTGSTDGLVQAQEFADNGRFTEAEAICVKYLKHDKQNEQAYYLLALIQIATGDIQKAVQYLKNVIYLKPKHYDALMYLATLTTEQGDEIGATRYRERAQRIKKRNFVQQVDL